MPPLLIGLLREGRTPPDRRVALTPKKCVELQETYPGLRMRVQPSSHRAFADQEYRDLGLEVSDDMAACDVLLGVKEVPVPELLPGKTYFFFSHTIKQQPRNRELLRTVLERGITLIDYELLTNATGERVVAVAVLAAAASIIVPVAFADASLGDVLEASAVHAYYYDTVPWYDELVHYQTLLQPGRTPWARRGPILLTLAVMLLVAAGSARRGPEDDALRRVLHHSAATTALTFVLALLVPFGRRP